MEIVRDKLIKITAGAVGIVAVGTYIFLYQSLICRFKKQHLDCRAIESEVRQARGAIARLKEKDERVILNEEDIPAGMDELTRFAKLKGISLISVTPGQAIGRGAGYKILPIEMEAVSTYEALGTFLCALDKLEKSLVTVNTLNVTADKERSLSLNIRLVINMYLADGDWTGHLESVFPQRAAKKTSYISWARNPFTLQKTSPRLFNGLILDGIMWDKETPMGIINNSIVKTGDSISGNIIVDIKQDRVILNDGSRDFELRLD